ncbi:hypothetical protein [Streptomyces xanthochromogenes]|uniref:hypothetical protein n=1 Tax=Streptomyces xanthochromogenes TaxID=67384 RepID=UPI0034467FE6
MRSTVPRPGPYCRHQDERPGVQGYGDLDDADRHSVATPYVDADAVPACPVDEAPAASGPGGKLGQ